MDNVFIRAVYTLVRDYLWL